MAQQQLQTQIVLSGRIDSSFGPLAAALDGLANKTLAVAASVNQVSQPILRTGKDVTKLYAGFDDAMRYIQAVSTLTEDQLLAVEKAARNAGKTTRYSATSSAEALAYGAEAGLEYKENIELLPDVLNMAAAGNMALETAMDQLLTILYSTGTPLNEAGSLIDHLAVAASSSKTDIESMGEAVERLGGISRYAKGGTTELMTMLAMMAQRGQEGSEAGTYLRNVMLALVAPTKGAAQVMQELAFTEEEMEEALEGVNLTNASKQIDEMGLRVYDTATGKLRPMIDILWDLKTITDAMTEQKRNEVLGNIFPKRTLSAATNLMGELDISYERIAEALEHTESAAKRMADTRESGIGGALRRLTNAADELKLSFGEELDDRIKLWAGSVRDLSLAISEMPPEAKNFLIDVAAAIGFMGPAAMFAGLTLKGLAGILAFIGSPFGAVVTGAVVLGLIVSNLELMARSERYNAIQRHFGVLGVSAEALKTAVSSLDGGMGTALANLDKYGQASEDAGTKYQGLLQQLSGDIQSAVVFGQTIDPDTAGKLFTLGDQMVGEVQKGIKSKQMQITGFVDLLFADDPTQAASIKGTLDGYFAGLYAEAENVGKSIRSQIAKGLEGDNELSNEEWAAIRSEIDRLNQINAQIQSIINAAEVEATLQRGMRLGFDAVETTMEEFAKQRAEVTESTNAYLDETIGYIIAAERAADKEGKGQYTDKELEDIVQETRQRGQGLIIENNENNAAAAVRFMETVFQGHFDELWGYGTALDDEVSRLMRENPGKSFENLLADAIVGGNLPEVDASAFTAFKAWWPLMEKLLPDAEEAKNWYAGQGEAIPEWIASLEQMKEMAQIILGGEPKNLLTHAFGEALGLGQGDDYTSQFKERKETDAAIINAQALNKWLEESAAWGLQLRETQDTEFWKGFAEYHEEQAGREFDIPEFITPEYMERYITDLLMEEYMNKIGMVAPNGSLIRDAFGSLVAQAGSLGAEAANAFNQSFQQNIGPGSVTGGDGGRPGLDIAGIVGGIPTAKFADGGRAVEASIFGEAGPEWAIPESHTQRTAELLNGARLASGFSWAELIEASGGLGGGTTYQNNMKVVFAPVITAADATGVKKVLEEEREKFVKQMRELREEEERKSWSS